MYNDLKADTFGNILNSYGRPSGDVIQPNGQIRNSYGAIRNDCNVINGSLYNAYGANTGINITDRYGAPSSFGSAVDVESRIYNDRLNNKLF